jgi:hypothetical protein
MKSSRTGALIAALTLVLSLALAACGGGGSEDSSSTSSAPTTSTPAETSTPDSSDSSGGPLTPPDTRLKLGQEATVGWVPFTETDSTVAKEGITVKATVEAIEMGSIDDFDDIELEADEKDSTPYYVKLRIEAASDAEPPPNEEPDIAFDAIDDRGQEQSSVTFIGEFERCDEEEMPRPFTDGASYEPCLTYLIPGGGSIEEVQWDDGPSEPNELTPYYDAPVVWAGS